MDKIFPDHWSFMLGEIALYSFVILLVTGVFLTLYFIPSSAIVTYHGGYLPLDGQKMTQAFASTVNLSFAVRGGLLMRQMHHWACDIFVGAIVVHMARVFFTGAFRKPRELNWIDRHDVADPRHRERFPRLLAARRPRLGHRYPHRVLDHLVDSPRWFATSAFWVFGGNFPGTAIIPRFFILHCLIVPLDHHRIGQCPPLLIGSPKAHPVPG